MLPTSPSYPKLLYLKWMQIKSACSYHLYGWPSVEYWSKQPPWHWPPPNDCLMWGSWDSHMTHLAHSHVDVALLACHTCTHMHHQLPWSSVCVCVCMWVYEISNASVVNLQLPRRFVQGCEWRTYSHGGCIHDGTYDRSILTVDVYMKVHMTDLFSRWMYTWRYIW